VANISHEFRTPLNMIIGMIDILTRKPDVDGETIPVFLREDLEIVRRNASYLADMVNDVLDMSQSETGQLLLRREWGDLGADLRNAVAVVQPLLDKKQLRLNVVVADDLPRIYYDRARIRQVVLNLVSNAARYTDAGEVSVEVSDESDHLLVSVRDTGLGIPADDLERVFEPFYQAGNVRERSREGSGLGLNICKQIVELHEGRIWVESQEGAGTTVTFRLPSEPPALASTPALRWLDQDWVYVNRTQWPAVPHLPNRQRMVVCDETGVLQQLYGSERPYVELVHVNDLNKVGSLLAQMPAHALLINAYSPQGLLTQVEAAARSLLGSDLPVVGCAFPPLYQSDNLPGVERILTKPVQYAQLAQVMAGLGRTVRRVLVVDDNVDAGQFFARMVSLISEDIDAQIVHNGADALAQMRTRVPDLVLLDLVMPQMDGRQFLRIKNADQALSHIPVVVVSAEDPASKKPASTVLMASLPRGLAHEAVLQTACKLATLLAQSPAALDREPG